MKYMRELASAPIYCIAIVTILASCSIFWPENNPVDPSASNYQGYATVAKSDEIQLLSPSSGNSLTGTSISINPVVGATSYELKLALSNDELDSSPLFDKADYTSNALDLSGAPLDSSYTYYGKVIARGTDGVIGSWSEVFSFTTYWSTSLTSITFSPITGTILAQGQTITLSSEPSGATFFLYD